MMMIREIGNQLERVVIKADFGGVSAEMLFNHFTQPDLITKWWPKSAEIDLHIGGQYNFNWPSPGFHLTGHFTTITPHTQLGYTWLWSHIPNAVQRQVDITFAAGGLTLIHHTYGVSESEQADRQSHIDGWFHFLSQLQTLLSD